MVQTKCLSPGPGIFHPYQRKSTGTYGRKTRARDSPGAYGVSALLKDEGVRCVFDAAGMAGAAMMGQFAGLLAGKDHPLLLRNQSLPRISGHSGEIREKPGRHHGFSLCPGRTVGSTQSPHGRILTTAELDCRILPETGTESCQTGFKHYVSGCFQNIFHMSENRCVLMLELDTLDKLYVRKTWFKT